jgi:hypothetical protein
MGLLDDLEQEAQRRKASLEDAQRRKLEGETVYKTRLEPAMQALNDYVARLVENLKFLKPRTAQRYALPGYGDVVGYVDHEYDLKLETQPLARQLTLSFQCLVATEECAPLEVQGASKVKAMNATFQKYRLGGPIEARKDDAGEIVQATFRPRGKIPMQAVIAADAESGAARMSFTNFDGFGTVTKVAGADQFNDALFENLARYLAREPSNLLKEELPDELRKQLQQKVQQEQIRRKWEQKMLEQQHDELAALKRDQSVRGRVERAVQDVRDKAPSLIDRVKGIFKK